MKPTWIRATVGALVLSATASADVLFLETHQLVPPAWSKDMRFGWSCDVDGGWAVIGAPGHTETLFEEGAVYVYRKDAGAWVFAQQLVAPDAMMQSFFGQAVSLDGDSLAVGAPAHNGSAGATYLFRRDGAGVWGFEQKLEVAGAPAGYALGTAVDLSGDELLAGAPDNWTGSGIVRRYTRSGSTWSDGGTFAPADGAATDRFGATISRDEGRVLVGAYLDSSSGVDSGSAYVFEWDGSAWVEAVELVPGDPEAGAWFGNEVLLVGNRAFVGAPWMDTGGFFSAGAAYCFELSGGTWSQTQKLVPATPGQYEYFGQALEMAAGRTLLVGRPGANTGEVVPHSLGIGGWNAGTPWIASGADPGSSFGNDLAAHGGSVLAMAVYDYDVASSGGSGFVYETDLPADVTCEGDGTNGGCPCGNDSVPGSEEGCLNSTGVGAILTAEGSTSVAADDLWIRIEQVPPNQNGIVFCGDTNGALPFGDGIRCANGNLTRFGVQTSGSDGILFQDDIASIGGFAAGDTCYFQGWYRDPIGTPCGTHFNVSSGLAITFCP